MAQPAKKPQPNSLSEILGLAQFLFGVERINDVPRTINEWKRIIDFSANYCRKNFPLPGIWLPKNPGFWAKFHELRNQGSSQKLLLDPGSPPDASEVEFITRLSSTYALLRLAQSVGNDDVDVSQPPIVPRVGEISLLRNVIKTGELINALDLHKHGNAVVFQNEKWQIVQQPV